MIALPNDDNTCGWYAALPPAGPAKKLIGLQKADYAIIGAGFAGLAAARR
ncbi:FAD-dependent oxidoreductase, partial [Acinetobacter baumannii]